MLSKILSDGRILLDNFEIRRTVDLMEKFHATRETHVQSSSQTR